MAHAAEPTTIIIACDAGTTNCRLLSAQLRKRLQGLGTVMHSSVDAIPAEASVVLVEEPFASRLQPRIRAGLPVVIYRDSVGDAAVDGLVASLTGGREPVVSTRG